MRLMGYRKLLTRRCFLKKIPFAVLYYPAFIVQNITVIILHWRGLNMKATGIVRRIDDLGRIVIPKEIRRSFRIKEGDPSLTTLKACEQFLSAMLKFGKRLGV